MRSIAVHRFRTGSPGSTSTLGLVTRRSSAPTDVSEGLSSCWSELGTPHPRFGASRGRPRNRGRYANDCSPPGPITVGESTVAPDDRECAPSGVSSGVRS